MFDRLPADGLQPYRHLYIHIPFCRHKCGYCDFNVYAGMDRLMPEYIDGLVRELEEARRTLPFEPLGTIYIGGGTPSLLPAELAKRLVESVRSVFEVATDAEVTLEANPASTDLIKLAAWRDAGVNRLSLGVQGFDQRALAVLERRSDGAQAVTAFTAARAAGFDNISIDLIYAVPFQDRASWLDTLQRAADLEPDHLSCYCLGFEEGTLLHRRRERGHLPEVAPDLQWEFLDLTVDELAASGYGRYEVSSWARPGFESRHNSAYWRCRPVYGAGAGAHSSATDGVRTWRWWNTARPREYLTACPRPVADGEELDASRASAERVMLGLRSANGMSDPQGFDSELSKLEAAGLIRRESGTVRPTRRGLDLHNQVALTVL